MLEQYTNINEAAGVSITIGKEGDVSINACLVNIRNNQLTIEKKVTGLRAPEELTRHFPAGTLMALNLGGKGLLQKQIEKTEEIDSQNFSLVLPNARMEDFYVQHIISGEQSFVSVVRKAEADKWIARLDGLGFRPLLLSLGPFPVYNVIAQLNVYDELLVFDGYTVRRNERSEWLSCKYGEADTSQFPLKIGAEKIDEKLLLPYAAAFQLVRSDRIDVIAPEVPVLQTRLTGLLAEKKLKVQGALVLSLFFITLLINFFLFSWLNGANAGLTEQVSRSSQNTSDIQQISEQVQQKDSLLKTLGWEEGINKSTLIDQVASLLPEDVTWTEAGIDPVDLAESRNRKTIVFANRKMHITGNAERIIPVNEWIARIKTKAWVKNVQLDNYSFSNEQNTGRFVIIIDY